MKAQKIDERINRITDILQQVQNLNGMIALHRAKSQDGFMLRQYEYMRGGVFGGIEGVVGRAWRGGGRVGGSVRQSV